MKRHCHNSSGVPAAKIYDCQELVAVLILNDVVAVLEAGAKEGALLVATKNLPIILNI